MTLDKVKEIVEGRLVSSPGNIDITIERAFASDMMSDVLTIDTKNLLLITGLSNIQTIRTAEMADILGIVLVRGKRATDDMLSIADELGIVIIETSWSMFRVCGALAGFGLNPVS
jgi:predicted transcriptional regulator